MSGCYAVFHKQLGDLLLLEPAFTRLRAWYGAPVAVLTRNGHAPLLRLMDGATFQHGLPLTPRSHLYCYDPLNKSALRSLFVPARKKIAILPECREMSWFHHPLFREIIVPELGDRYVARYFWENTPVPAAEPFRPPSLAPPPESWRPPEIREGPFLLLNPTAGWRQKSWLPDGWLRVLHALREAGAPSAIMTSASTDWQVGHCQEITRGAGTLVRTFASGTTLENFLWLCANASMVLTVDGAASHLAAAFGVKNLTLFGPTNIHNWHHATAKNRALRAPADTDGKHRTRNLSAAAVTTAALELWLAH
jgi:ADP-heptose:LPS heptosyltransferase